MTLENQIKSLLINRIYNLRDYINSHLNNSIFLILENNSSDVVTSFTKTRYDLSTSLIQFDINSSFVLNFNDIKIIIDRLSFVDQVEVDDNKEKKFFNDIQSMNIEQILFYIFDKKISYSIYFKDKAIKKNIKFKIKNLKNFIDKINMITEEMPKLDNILNKLF